MMIATLDDARVEAQRGMAHRMEYRCPACAQPVVLHARVGGWVIPHFKHKTQSPCPYGRGESDGHRAIKHLLCDHYRHKGYEAELEFTVAKRRADVFVKGINVAFEVEFSSKEAGEFLSKCRDYERARVRSLWILKQRTNYVNVEPGQKVMVATSPVLGAYFSTKLKGPHVAFFSHVHGRPVVIRGRLSSHMLYKEDFGDYQGGPYPSRRYMILSVEEIIRQIDGPPRFPGANACRSPVMHELQEAA